MPKIKKQFRKKTKILEKRKMKALENIEMGAKDFVKRGVKTNQLVLGKPRTRPMFMTNKKVL
jgi:hypothetical protein